MVVPQMPTVRIQSDLTSAPATQTIVEMAEIASTHVSFFLNLVPKIFSAFHMATGLLKPDKTLRKRSFSPGSFSWRNWTETEHGISNQQARRQLFPLEKHMINKAWQVCIGGDWATQPAGFFRASSRLYSLVSRGVRGMA